MAFSKFIYLQLIVSPLPRGRSKECHDLIFAPISLEERAHASCWLTSLFSRERARARGSEYERRGSFTHWHSRQWRGAGREQFNVSPPIFAQQQRCNGYLVFFYLLFLKFESPLEVIQLTWYHLYIALFPFISFFFYIFFYCLDVCSTDNFKDLPKHTASSQITNYGKQRLRLEKCMISGKVWHILILLDQKNAWC